METFSQGEFYEVSRSTATAPGCYWVRLALLALPGIKIEAGRICCLDLKKWLPGFVSVYSWFHNDPFAS